MPIARHWAFTVWPGHLTIHSTLTEWFHWAKKKTSGITYLVMQNEHGTNEGGHHIQGFLTAATKKREATLGHQFFVKPEAFQLMKKNSTPTANRAYCTDDSKRVPDTTFFEYGTVPGATPSKIEAMCDLVKSHGLKRAIDSDPATYVRHCNGLRELDNHYKRQKIRSEHIHVIVIVGPPGSGKSWWAKRLFDPGQTFTLPAVPRSGQAWFDNYSGERTLLIDEFSGRIEFELFKNMLDPYEMQCPIKGTYNPAMWDTVVVTTNFHPNTWYGHDVDWWGTESLGPIQRRIHHFIEATGNYNQGTHSYQVHNWMNGEESPQLTTLPTRSAFFDYDEESEPAPALQQNNPPVTDAPAPLPVPVDADPPLEDLLNDFTDQDLAAEMDFLNGLTDTILESNDPDNILLGTDGDAEPLRGINIDRSKDIY